MMQRIPGEHLGGSTVRLCATLNADQVERGSGLWLRADSDHGMLAFDNMSGRWLKGSQPWTALEVALDVPVGITWLNFGLVQVGRGVTCIKDVALTATGRGGGSLPVGIGT